MVDRPIYDGTPPARGPVEDFIGALRDVTLFEFYRAEDERLASRVRLVQVLRRALADGGIDPIPALRQLAMETGWDMEEFLDQCMRFPAAVPMVRERDGVRRRLRCSGCHRRERPTDDERFYRCDECIKYWMEVVRRAQPAPGVVVFRTYTPAARCAHATDETVLIEPWEDSGIGPGFCEICLTQELDRRAQRSERR